VCVLERFVSLMKDHDVDGSDADRGNVSPAVEASSSADPSRCVCGGPGVALPLLDSMQLD
jgi:hypothetical protein